MDSSTKAKLDLGAAEVVDVLEDAVDERQDVELGLIPTVSQVFNCQLIHITGFPRLHLGGEDVVELAHGHGGYLGIAVGGEVKDVEIVKFAKFIETLITECCAFIGHS